MSTKEKILEAALTLFSEQGYDGTSVEQIASAIGVKAPSLYKHYKGKEDILNTIIECAEDRYDEMFGSEKKIGKLPQNKKEFIAATMNKITFTIQDPMIRKIRMLLVQEQFRNQRFAEITSRHQLEGIQGMYAKIIREMMKKGLFKKDDPKMLAVELTSAAVLQIARADRNPQDADEAFKSIKKHVTHFCDVYMCESADN
ncbi:MAG: TetR/AcrR family transcriptional regulator [Treponema sp.]|nr:TetR/AcrR family transcriptional regulator [Treponema sp.]